MLTIGGPELLACPKARHSAWCLDLPGIDSESLVCSPLHKDVLSTGMSGRLRTDACKTHRCPHSRLKGDRDTTGVHMMVVPGLAALFWYALPCQLFLLPHNPMLLVPGHNVCGHSWRRRLHR